MRIDRNGRRVKDTFTISDSLYGMPYSCSWGRYGGYYNYGGYYTGKPKAKTENEYIKQYTQDLIDYAAMVGIDEDTIINLINDGFSLDEIENMIYEHEYYYEMEGFDDAVTEI